MWHVAVAADLIGGIDNDDALQFCQNVSCLAKHCRLADAWRSQDKHALSGFDQILDDVNGSVHCPPNPACQPHDVAPPVAYGRDTVQCPLDSCTVIGVEH